MSELQDSTFFVIKLLLSYRKKKVNFIILTVRYDGILYGRIGSGYFWEFGSGSTSLGSATLLIIVSSLP